MPKGPKGEERPADANARAVLVAKIATGEKTETLLIFLFSTPIRLNFQRSSFLIALRY